MIPGFQNLTYFEVLDISPDSANKEVQEAYYRVRAAFSHNSLASYSLYTPSERDNILRLVEEAYHTLIDERARQEYEQGLKKEKKVARPYKATQEFLPLTPAKPEQKRRENLPYSEDKKADEPASSQDMQETIAEETPGQGGPGEKDKEDTASGILYTDAEAAEVEEEYHPEEASERKPEKEAEEVQPMERDTGADHSGEEQAEESRESSSAGGLATGADAAPVSGGEDQGTLKEDAGDDPVRPKGPLPTREGQLSIQEAKAARARGEKITIEGSLKSRVSDLPEQVFISPSKAGSSEEKQEETKPQSGRQEGYEKGAFEDTVYNLPQTRKTSTPLDYLDTDYSGEYLKRVRESQGMDLYKAWEVTKIRKPILEAIENEELKRLPADVFLRGMLLIYARFLGLEEPEEVVKGYMERLIAARDWMD